MAGVRKSSYLQIRVTPRQKAALRRLARDARKDVSRFVLDRVLPDTGLRLQSLLDGLAKTSQPQPVLAELGDVLMELPATEFTAAVRALDVRSLSEFHQALIAAMVEDAAHRKRVAPPVWTSRIGPLPEPYFASELPSVRLHLLSRSPPPYRRRNIFLDASLADRV
ncbi:MAG TPA: hypothetical protein VGM03_21180 [Phycisphaerae bacterium]